MASFGENLRRERELRGVSLREVAESTKISVRFLQALEEDRMEVLPGGLFPRSFVRQYAQYIGLDPERAAADFMAAHRETPLERRQPPTPNRRLTVSPGHVFLGAVALLAVVLTTWHVSGEKDSAAVPERAPEPAAPAVLPTDRVYPPPGAEPASVAPARDGLVLTMTAQQDCWVEVRADGETVINRVLAEGESETLAAEGEIVLSVGNAGGLSLRLNDRPAAPLGRSGEVRKNIVITRQNLPSLVEKGGSPAPDGHSG